jgi:hypothetical protein
MRASSPPLVVVGGNLPGMDAREMHAENAPNVLYNVDLSKRGVYRDRPGLSLSALKQTGNRVMGMHPMRVNGRFMLVAILASASAPSWNSVSSYYSPEGMRLQLYQPAYSSAGYELTLAGEVNLSGGVATRSSGNRQVRFSEPWTKKHLYDFAQVGNRLYFCNGNGNFFELEWDGGPLSYIPNTSCEGIILRTGGDNAGGFLETGIAPDVQSYILGNFRPSSLNVYAGQLTAAGFFHNETAPISLPLPSSGETLVAEEFIVGAQRDAVTIANRIAYVGELNLPRSFPLEDVGATLFQTSDIVATADISNTIIVFTKEGVFRTVGYGSQSLGNVRFARKRLVGAHALCRFGDNDEKLFFVANDGCYITDGQSVQKVSNEMDPLWFSTRKPKVTRKTEQNLRKTPFPFFVNLSALGNVICVNDRRRKQVMVALPSSGFAENNMVWVWNYADVADQMGPGKWAVWSGGLEPYRESTVASSFAPSSVAAGNPTTINKMSHGITNGQTVRIADTSFDALNGNHVITYVNANRFTVAVDSSSSGGVTGGTVYPPLGTGSNSDVAGTPNECWHITYMVVDEAPEGDHIYVGTTVGIFRLGVNSDFTAQTLNGPTMTGFPVLISMGVTGRVDVDGRIVFTDVVTRELQTMRNQRDDSDAAKTVAIVRSEGESQKYMNADLEDFEFETVLDNMQEGVSEATKSAMGSSTNPSMYLGDSTAGTSSPLISPSFHDFYARINAPDEDGRGIRVDIYRAAVDRPHDLEIAEIRVHGSPKGGSQRQS